MFIGTYSSLFIAAPLLYYIQPNRRAIAKDAEPASPTPAPAPRPRPSGRRAEAAVELHSAGSRPDARSSSAMRRAGSGSAARSIWVRCWCFPTGPRPGRSRRLRRKGWRRFLRMAAIELLLLGFGRRIAPVERGIAQRPESRRDQGRADGYRGGLPHLQYAGGRGPPRRRRAAAACLNRRHAICGGRGTTGWSPAMPPNSDAGSAAFFGIGHNGGPPLDPGVGMAAVLLEKGACPRLEDTAARDRLGPSGARRGVGDQLSRIYGRAA